MAYCARGLKNWEVSDKNVLQTEVSSQVEDQRNEQELPIGGSGKNVEYTKNHCIVGGLFHFVSARFWKYSKSSFAIRWGIGYVMDLLRKRKCNIAAKAQGRFTRTRFLLVVSFFSDLRMIWNVENGVAYWWRRLQSMSLTYGDWPPTLPLVTE